MPITNNYYQRLDKGKACGLGICSGLSALEIIGIALVILRAMHKIDLSWWKAFLPLYIMPAATIAIAILSVVAMAVYHFSQALFIRRQNYHERTT